MAGLQEHGDRFTRKLILTKVFPIPQKLIVAHYLEFLPKAKE